MLDDLFGGVVALAVGLVDVDFFVVDLVGDEQAHGQVGHLAEHVENGELHGRDGNPDGEALQFVGAAVDGDGGDKGVEVAGVLADEEGRDAADEDWIDEVHLLSVRDGDALVAVFGADAADVLLFAIEELDGLDDDGIFEKLALEDWLLQDSVQPRVALLKSSGKTMPGGIEELSAGGWREAGGGDAYGKGGADKVAAVRLHALSPCNSHNRYFHSPLQNRGSVLPRRLLTDAVTRGSTPNDNHQCSCILQTYVKDWVINVYVTSVVDTNRAFCKRTIPADVSEAMPKHLIWPVI